MERIKFLSPVAQFIGCACLMVNLAGFCCITAALPEEEIKQLEQILSDSEIDLNIKRMELQAKVSEISKRFTKIIFTVTSIPGIFILCLCVTGNWQFENIQQLFIPINLAPLIAELINYLGGPKEQSFGS
jgi:hypothetical protein